MSSGTAAPLWGALLLVLLSFGCGPSISFNGGVLRKGGVAYRIGPLDPAFRRVHVEGNDLAFYEAGAGTIAVNATCKDYEDVPHRALLNHLLFGTTHRSYLVDEEVILDGRAARHALIEAELDGVPVRLEVYLLTRGYCVFDLSYISDRRATAQAEFTRFVHGFRILDVPVD